MPLFLLSPRQAEQFMKPVIGHRFDDARMREWQKRSKPFGVTGQRELEIDDRAMSFVKAMARDWKNPVSKHAKAILEAEEMTY